MNTYLILSWNWIFLKVKLYFIYVGWFWTPYMNCCSYQKLFTSVTNIYSFMAKYKSQSVYYM